MPPKSPTLYNLNKTTIWFSVASIMLLIGLVTMVLKDSTREWKSYQRRFMELTREKAENELREVEKQVNEEKLKALGDELATAEKNIADHQEKIKGIEAELARLDVAITKSRSYFQDLKQVYDSDKYYFEEYRAHGDKEKAKAYEEKLLKMEPDHKRSQQDLELVQAQRDEKQKELDEFLGKEKELKLEIKRVTSDVTRVKNKIESLKPSWVTALLNAPMLDFIKPTLQIQQIVVEDLHDDYYFTHVQKVDRCITCHLGVDQAGLENAPVPFKSHPRLDLFVSQNSPHPMEKFGCTTCHGGSGHSVSFETAAHTPKNEEQAKEWEKEYHWKPMKHWAEKMLPLNHTEASCVKCHTGVLDIPEAPKLNQGRRLVQQFGCLGCHKVEGFEKLWNPGPSLVHVQSKLDTDWIARWLHNPKEFRASTKMPRIFHLSNSADPESKDKNDATILSIATYLMKNSDPVSLQTVPEKGNPEVGKKLVGELGCLGCHAVGDQAANDHGPELSGLGSKVKPEWLFTWLKNPKHYYENTRMPNLRLSDQEASDITSYLLTLRNEKFESVRTPVVKPEVVDDLAISFMTGNMRFKDAQTALEKLSFDERLEFVGKKSIAHQGCFACHDIKGFEDAKPIGVELSQEGSKDVHLLDFGFQHFEHTRQEWFFQKLKNPRIFDEGRDKNYHEKLKMPQFDFTDEQAEDITTFILSLQKASIPLEMMNQLSLAEEQVEAGRKLATKFNCQGCHTVDGIEGRVRALIEDKGNAPPILDGEGSKVQSDWLYHFLEHPSTIRPWLQYRMPTFDFNEEQLTSLVQYFHNLSDMPMAFTPDKQPQPSAEMVAHGRELFKSFQCIKCHKANPEPGLSASFLAPNLVMTKDRLRPDWVLEWLKDPQVIQAGTMMPGFFPEGQSPMPNIFDGDASKQIEAIRDYLWVFGAEEAGIVIEPPQAQTKN